MCPLCKDRGVCEAPNSLEENGGWEVCPMCHPEPPREPSKWLHWLQTFLFVVTLPLWPFFYLLCRLEAKPCPHCGEKWYTELTGEWDGEDWKCRRCGHVWVVPYHE